MASSNNSDRPASYTDDELSNALRSFYDNSSSSSSDIDASCAHILGYADPRHTMSMLQRITATIILDYEHRHLHASSSCAAPSMDELLIRASQFHAAHGPILDLQTVISDQYPAMGLAAEFKRSSPSKGPIAPPTLKAGERACLYYEAGACVISVLTEGRWFGGSLADLTEARLATSSTTATYAKKKSRPAILRKDFITSTYQIAEAAAAGADTILLIVAITPATLLARLIDYARTIVGMEPLVEVHSRGELNVAFHAGARVLGVNNRNLHTFTLDMDRTDDVASELTNRGLIFHPDDYEKNSTIAAAAAQRHRITLCALSGMSTLHDVHRYRQVGVSMCLIGESLMRSPDVRSAIRGLCLDPIDYYNSITNNNNGGSSSTVVGEGGAGVAASSSVAAGGAYIGGMKIIKICGITTPHDALVACRAGANLIGIIFAEKSKRKVSTSTATEIVSAVREFGERSDRITIALDDDSDYGNGKKAGFNGELSSSGSASVISTLVVRARTLEQITSRRPIVVGIFQNQSIDFIMNIVNECGIDMIQLHGNEGMEASNSKNYGVPVIRVVDIELGVEFDDDKRLSSAEIASTILGKVTADPYAILLDTSGGGTGLTFDWTIAESLQNMGLPVIVAGGLTPDNIGMVVGGARPWGVDVAGGVEAGPGMKDCDKVRKFVAEARSAAVEAGKGF